MPSPRGRGGEVRASAQAIKEHDYGVGGDLREHKNASRKPVGASESAV